MTIVLTHSPPPPVSRPGIHLLSAGPSLWRVIDTQGKVLGHVQEVGDAGGRRYRARRFHAVAHTFRDLGDFWIPDDAVDCVRYAR